MFCQEIKFLKPMNHFNPAVLRVAVWLPPEGTLGRIAKQIANHSPELIVEVFNWLDVDDNTRLFRDRAWMEFDILFSNSHIFDWYPNHVNQAIPPELAQKICILYCSPNFHSTHHPESLNFIHGANYSALSKEIRSRLEAIGIENPIWTPFGVDLNFFKPNIDQSHKSIINIGFVCQPKDKLSGYYQNKNCEEFEEICRRLNAKPVYIRGQSLDTASLYRNIDLLICCSQSDSGPLSILEAAACGIPVLSKPVGNLNEIGAIKKFTTIMEAVKQIIVWRVSPEQCKLDTEAVYREVIQNWLSKKLIDEHLLPWFARVKEAQIQARIENANTKIRLHIPAVPHTITRSEFSHCAFTGKVLRFSPMMQSREGFEVYHYGVETSQSGAAKQIDLFTVDEWQQLRIASYKKIHPEKTDAEVADYFSDKTQFAGDLAQMGTPLYDEFNRRLRVQLQRNYRSRATDIVCLPFDRAHQAAIEGLPVVAMETGIGYPNSYRDYRIFESYAWLHHELGMIQSQHCSNYWFVIPNYFDSLEWPLSLNPDKNKVGFFGRIYDNKGVPVVVEMARRYPMIEFVICGQGDPKPYLTLPNITYKPPIHGKERGEYLGSLMALIAPSVFIEPFCGVAVEAQLCGTPVLTVDYGAQTETVEQGVSGLRCHTLGDFCLGLRMVMDGVFDRQYIRARAIERYDMYNVAKQYEHAFKCVLDITNGQDGYNSQISHLQLANPEQSSILDFLEIGSIHHPATAYRKADVATTGHIVHPTNPSSSKSMVKIQKLLLCCSGKSGMVDFWYIPRETAIRHCCPIWMEDYVTLDRDDPELLEELAQFNMGVDSFSFGGQVEAVSLAEFCVDNQISIIRRLDINVPGACELLRDYLSSPDSILPLEVHFVAISMTDKDTLMETIQLCTAASYNVNIDGFSVNLKFR